MEHISYLILENGQIFKAKNFGAKGNVTGEIVFTTGMTGYLETLTDPSYYGQIVVQTFPLIGNYGVIPADFESTKSYIKAYIVREWCQEPSNCRCECNLDTFLKNQNIIGLYDLDTRELTKIIREYGVMNAKITTHKQDVQKIVKQLKSNKIYNAVKSVSCKTISTIKIPQSKYKVVIWDFGSKENIRRELLKRNCEVTTVPYNTKASQIKGLVPDGIILTNGPGDPKENKEIIQELSSLCNLGIPIFGICLGHQLLALAQGAKTSKLKYGHRGANQPVKDMRTGKLYITSQNHGYTVLRESLPPHGRLIFENANDNTCEGISYQNMPAFSVQFHPEAAPGPHDTAFLFDNFISLMEVKK